MFGYLRPCVAELKVKDNELYKGSYCGVCRATKLCCGNAPRLALQYDTAILALLLMSASGAEPEPVRRSCMMHPGKKHLSLENHPCIDFSAAMGTLLASAKLRDNWQDERSLWAPPAILAFSAGERRAKRLVGEAASGVERDLKAFYALEKRGGVSLDALADGFGLVLERAVAAAPVENEFSRRAVSRLCYHLGRWIYLIDALDDMAKDKKSGSFNPLLGADEETARLLAAESCRWAAGQCVQAMELMELKFARPILENVFYLGMEETLLRVLASPAKGSIDEKSL